jgi:PASTA domain
MDWLFDPFMLLKAIIDLIRLDRGPGRSRPPRRPTVPDLHGLPGGHARSTLADADLQVNRVWLNDHPATAEGVVVDQSPAKGKRVRRGRTVTIYVQHDADSASRFTQSKTLTPRASDTHS